MKGGWMMSVLGFGGDGAEEKNPIIIDDGPLQTLNVRSYLKKKTQTLFSFALVE